MKTLADAVVGDRVVVFSQGHKALSGPYGTIEKVSAHQVTACGEKWKRSGGSRVGDKSRFTMRYLRLLTPELERDIAEAVREQAAKAACLAAADILQSAARNSGADAIRLAALLPAELRKAAK